MGTLLQDITEALAERYRVERELGRGGMATVYLADDLKHGRRVAIKVMSPDVSSSVGSERFQREIQIAARLSHPHILPVHDSGVAGGLLYYVMPFVEGESLRARMNRESQLPIEDAVQITCEVCDALQYAHDQGVVHRDIKPENVLLHGGHAVVMDFGIARIVNDSTAEKLTATGLSLGTAQYMSPEQFVGEHVDGRADLYSVACMLYEMLVGQTPFTGPNAMAIIARATMEMPSSIRVVRNSVPEEIEDAVMTALEKVPADRYPSMTRFKQSLLGMTGATAHMRATTRHVARPSAYRMAVEQPAPRWSARRIGIVAAIAVVVIGGGIAGWRFGLKSRQLDAAGAIGGLDPKHIAVLYFSADSSRPGLRPIADGLTESLIGQLAQVPALDVVSRNGVAPFRGADPSIDSVAKKFSVGSIVQGSVEETKRGVRVTVKLVDAQSGVSLGSKSIERDSADMVQLQGEVVGEVANFLRPLVGGEVELKSERAQTSSTAAWLLVQRAQRERSDGERLLNAGDATGALRSLAGADSMLARAAALDGRWAAVPEARARVAYRRAAALRADPRASGVAIDSGIVYADQAIALDDRDADALEMRGALLYARYTMHLVADPSGADRTLDAAEADLTKATTLNPNQAGAWSLLSRLQYNRQSVVKANLAAQQAYRADAYLENASEIVSRLFWTSYDLGAFPDADRWCAEGHRRFPTAPFFVECRLWLQGTKYAGSPDPREAWKLVDTLKAITPPAKWQTESALGRILVAGVLARAWLADTTRHVLQDSARKVLVAARVPQDVDPTLELTGYEAVVRVQLRDYDEAMNLIERYLTVNPEHRKGFATNAAGWWRDLQDKPRYKALIAGTR